MGDIAELDYCYYDFEGFEDNVESILRCKYCNSNRVYWYLLNGNKFILYDYDTNKQHVCAEPKFIFKEGEFIRVT